MSVKLTLVYVASFLVGALMIIFIFVAAKWFNQATMQTKVINPKAGIECVIVSTTDGASIDCWKEN